jgi:RNA polymerase sigma-70 factor (ECF subfamily)
MKNHPQRTLFKSYLAPVLDTAYGTALYLTGDRGMAEELVETAAVTAYTAFAATRPGTSFQVWFLRILMEAFQARYQDCAPRSTLPVARDCGQQLSRGAANQRLNGERGAWSVVRKRSDLIAAFAALPVEQRAVCALYFMGDFSYVEMAEMTGGALETTRRQLHEGRARLQALVREAEAASASLHSGAACCVPSAV